jgi:hypothetical protein
VDNAALSRVEGIQANGTAATLRSLRGAARHGLQGAVSAVAVALGVENDAPPALERKRTVRHYGDKELES